MSVFLLLQVIAFAPLVDAPLIASTADSFGVPRDIAYAAAWKETGTGLHWNALGPGTIDSTWQGDVLVVRRVCREIGRFQMKPCINWAARLHDPLCTYRTIRYDRLISIHCGIENLRFLVDKYHDPVIVLQRQNGDGPQALAYVLDGLAYDGWLHIKHEEYFDSYTYPHQGPTR